MHVWAGCTTYGFTASCNMSEHVTQQDDGHGMTTEFAHSAKEALNPAPPQTSKPYFCGYLRCLPAAMRHDEIYWWLMINWLVKWIDPEVMLIMVAVACFLYKYRCFGQKQNIPNLHPSLNDTAAGEEAYSARTTHFCVTNTANIVASIGRLLRDNLKNGARPSVPQRHIATEFQCILPIPTW